MTASLAWAGVRSVELLWVPGVHGNEEEDKIIRYVIKENMPGTEPT